MIIIKQRKSLKISHLNKVSILLKTAIKIICLVKLENSLSIFKLKTIKIQTIKIQKAL